MNQTTTKSICPYCQEALDETSSAACPECGQAHHHECWHAAGKCSTPACCGQVELPPQLLVPAVGRRIDPRSIVTLLTLAVVPLLIVALSIAVIKPGASADRWILVAVVTAALGFDYVNGMNDSANAIATVVSTRVLTPAMALLLASALNFVGALLFTGVAKFISKDIFYADKITILMILCGLLGAVIWSWAMTAIGMPVSLSHSLIGGLMGAVLVGLGAAGVKLAGVLTVVMWMIMAPAIGYVAGLALMLGLMWAFRRVAPHKINKHFRVWQIASASLMAFSHGGNDAQKAMGVIALALFTAGVQTTQDVPLWVKIACATVIALGTGLGGWRVIRTLGHKMIKLAPIHGFAAETAAAGAILLATQMHAPVSTTHVISASIMGVGSSTRLSAVRWGVASNIIFAWVLTIPMCALVAAVLYLIVRVAGLS